ARRTTRKKFPAQTQTRGATKMKAATKMSTRTVDNPKIVSREEWLVARKKLLAREKQLTRERDAVAAERRQLPWVKVEKNYVFDSPSGKKTLADLFDGKSQLIVYHLMFGPEWQEACPSCSFNMDHTDPALMHLAQRDVSFAAVSRAPISKIEAFKKRMGWKFNWVSSYGSDPVELPSHAHGMEVQLGLVLRKRLQLRLPRLLQAGAIGQGQGRIQL